MRTSAQSKKNYNQSIENKVWNTKGEIFQVLSKISSETSKSMNIPYLSGHRFSDLFRAELSKFEEDYLEIIFINIRYISKPKLLQF